MSEILAVDLGGTNLRAAIVNAEGKIQYRTSIRTPQHEATPKALVALCRDVLAEYPAAHAVIGLPGRIDHAAGQLEHAPNLPSAWAPLLSESLLSEALGIPVHIGNDADLAAVGEAFFGAGRGHADVVYVTVSTGIGAGVMLGGRVLRGQRSLAEVGHCTLDIHAFYRGEPCTFEQLASGTALVRMAAEAGLPANGAAVMERVNASDPVALALWARLTQAAAIGFTNLCFCYTPQVVVIGGGLGLTGELLYGPIRNHLAAHGPPRLPQPIQIVGAQLGDDAALTGAAGWMRAIGMPT